LVADWDEARRFYWDGMLLRCSREIAKDLPLLLFITIKEPINLAAPEKDESGLTMISKTVIEKSLADRLKIQKAQQYGPLTHSPHVIRRCYNDANVTYFCTGPRSNASHRPQG